MSCSSKSGGSEQQEVILYCSADQDVAKPIIAEFEKLTGIKVQAKFDDEASKTTGLAQRIRAEAASPTADVFWSNEIFHTVTLASDGLLAPYDPPHDLLKDRPARYIDSQGRWHGFSLRARAIVYSTKRVKPDEAPRRLEDLLTPKWKGRIAMARPQFGTTGGDVASWFAHYGPQRAGEILAALRANDVLLVDGNSTAVTMVVNGLADVALTDTDDVYSAQADNKPVARNYLDQDGDGVLTFPNTVAIIKGGPNSNAAKKLVDFLLSVQVETMLVNSDSHCAPTLPRVAKEYPQYAIPHALDIDYQRVAEQLTPAIKASQEIFK